MQSSSSYSSSPMNIQTTNLAAATSLRNNYPNSQERLISVQKVSSAGGNIVQESADAPYTP